MMHIHTGSYYVSCLPVSECFSAVFVDSMFPLRGVQRRTSVSTEVPPSLRKTLKVKLLLNPAHRQAELQTVILNKRLTIYYIYSHAWHYIYYIYYYYYI
jgi:hypothetical protein